MIDTTYFELLKLNVEDQNLSDHGFRLIVKNTIELAIQLMKDDNE